MKTVRDACKLQPNALAVTRDHISEHHGMRRRP